MDEANRLMLVVYMFSNPGGQTESLIVRQVPPLRDLQWALWFGQSLTWHSTRCALISVLGSGDISSELVGWGKITDLDHNTR